MLRNKVDPGLRPAQRKREGQQFKAVPVRRPRPRDRATSAGRGRRFAPQLGKHARCNSVDLTDNVVVYLLLERAEMTPRHPAGKQQAHDVNSQFRVLAPEEGYGERSGTIRDGFGLYISPKDDKCEITEEFEGFVGVFSSQGGIRQYTCDRVFPSQLVVFLK